MGNLQRCPICNAEAIEYVGVSDGNGDYGTQCCDTYVCHNCGYEETDNCFNCDDDEEFGSTEYQLEVHNGKFD